MSLGQLEITFVADDVLEATLLREALARRANRARVRHAPTVSDALSGGPRPDVLLIDLVRGGGIEAIRTAVSRAPGIPVVGLAGGGLDLETGLRAGARQVLDRDRIDIEGIVRALEQALGESLVSDLSGAERRRPPERIDLPTDRAFEVDATLGAQPVDPDLRGRKRRVRMLDVSLGGALVETRGPARTAVEDEPAVLTIRYPGASFHLEGVIRRIDRRGMKSRVGIEFAPDASIRPKLEALYRYAADDGEDGADEG